jgi:hypothetical protein
MIQSSSIIKTFVKGWKRAERAERRAAATSTRARELMLGLKSRAEGLVRLARDARDAVEMIQHAVPYGGSRCTWTENVRDVVFSYRTSMLNVLYVYGTVRKAGFPRSYIVAFEPVSSSLPDRFC